MKSNVDEFDIDQFKNVPSGFNILKSRVDKVDKDKVDKVGKNVNAINTSVHVQKQIMMLKSMRLKVKRPVLLALLLLLLLVLLIIKYLTPIVQ